MKKTNSLFSILSLLICLSASLTVYGQNGIRVGITGGPNASQIKTHWYLMGRLWRYNTGLAIAKPLSGNFSLSSELVYSREGSRSEFNRPGIDTKQITHFDYISLPIMVRFRPGGKALFVQAGGKFSYLVNHEMIFINNNNTRTSSLNHLRQWDAGATGGVGYWLGNHVTVDLRYYHGLAPLMKKHWVLDPDTLESFYGADRWVNRVWSLNMTIYLF